MTITINHGMPTSPFFIIAQPRQEHKEPLIDREDKAIVILNDTKGNNSYKVELIDKWTLEETDFDSMNAFALLAYGISADSLKKQLLAKYPALQKEFKLEYWLLKRL